MIRLTSKGVGHVPQVPHNLAAWGAIKELLRVKALEGAVTTRKDVLEVLEYCGHWDKKFQPNTDYLTYALKMGWLTES